MIRGRKSVIAEVFNRVQHALAQFIYSGKKEDVIAF